MDEKIFLHLASQNSDYQSIKDINGFINKSVKNHSLVDDLEFIESNKTDLAGYKNFEIPSFSFLMEPKTDLRFPKSSNRWLIFLISLLLIIGFYALISKTKEVNYQIAFLPDNSELHLIGDSYFELANYFNKEERRMNLFGSAFFDISHNPDKPFYIHHKDFDIVVLGTSFMIEQSDHGTSLKVISGKVKVITKNTELFLVKNDVLKTTNTNFSISKIFYQDQRLINEKFVDEGLDAVFQKLSSKYHFNLEQESNIKFNSCKFNGQFENASITDILEELKIIFNLKFDIEKNKIILKEIDC